MVLADSTGPSAATYKLVESIGFDETGVGLLGAGEELGEALHIYRPLHGKL